MKNLKIGILTEIVNYHSGSRAPLEIAKGLAGLGQNVTVYAYNFMLDKLAAKDLGKHKVKIKTFPKPNIPYIGKYFAIGKYLASISLAKTLKKERPDIMTFSGTPPFFFAAKATGIPVVRIYQGTQFDALLEKKSPQEKPGALTRLINRIANIYIYLVDFTSFRMSNGVVAISKYCADEGEQLYRRKVASIIYHGTTPLPKTKISPGKSRTKTINIISVSRITPYKGFHKIIEALKKVKTDKKITFTIAGSQPKPAYLKYLKKIGAGMVKIKIDPTDCELAKLYANSDIYASADRYLYFGLPICEAAYFKNPTVSLDLAAAGEIVDHGKTGFIAKNQQELTGYFEKLVNDPKLAKIMGKAAQKRAQKVFTWKRCATSYLQVFKKIVTEGQRDH